MSHAISGTLTQATPNAPWSQPPLKHVVETPQPHRHTPQGPYYHNTPKAPPLSNPFSACAHAKDSLQSASRSINTRSVRPTDSLRLSPSQRNLLPPEARRAYDDTCDLISNLETGNIPPSVTPADLHSLVTPLASGIRTAQFPPSLSEYQIALSNRLQSGYIGYICAFI